MVKYSLTVLCLFIITISSAQDPIVGSPSNISELTCFDNKLFFHDNNSVFYIDGSNSPQLVTSSITTNNPSNLTVVGNQLIYRVTDNNSNRVIAFIDPSTTSQNLLPNNSTGGNVDYNAYGILEHNNEMFLAGNFQGGNQQIAKFSVPITLGSVPSLSTGATINGDVYDAHFWSNERQSKPKESLVLDNAGSKLYFSSLNSGSFCYSYDIATKNISQINTIETPITGNFNGYFTPIGDFMVFFGKDQAFDPIELIAINTSTDVATTVTSVTFPSHPIQFNNSLFFSDFVTGQGNMIWYIDGNALGSTITSSDLVQVENNNIIIAGGQGSSNYSHNEWNVLNSELRWGGNEVTGSPGNYTVQMEDCIFPFNFQGSNYFFGFDFSAISPVLYSCTAQNTPLTCFPFVDWNLKPWYAKEYNNKLYLHVPGIASNGLWTYPEVDTSGLCYSGNIDTIPCIGIDGKLNLANTVNPVNGSEVLLINPDNNVASIPLINLIGTDGDTNSMNEIQVLSISSNDLTLSNGGGTITLPSSGDDLGNHTATTSIDANNNSIVNLTPPTNNNDAATMAYVDAHTDADADINNEIQVLSISSNDLTLSNGGGTITLPSSGGGSIISDGDGDTRVDTESTPDNDEVQITLDGVLQYQLRRVFNNVIMDVRNSENTIIGQDAGLNINNNTDGSTFIGQSAGESNTSGSFNTYIGENAAKTNQTSDENVAIGFNAMVNSVSGYRCVAIGSNALAKTDGFYNVGVGRVAGGGLITGNSNTLIGDQAAFLFRTGNSNVFLGRNAGNQLRNGDENIMIGFGAGPLQQDSVMSNSIAIGHNARVTSDNQVVIGTTTTLDIGGYQDWTNYSDKRIKNNITSNVVGLEFIKKLNPVSYNVDYHKIAQLIGEDDSGESALREKTYDLRNQKSKKVDYGFIAQEVESTINDLGIEFQGVQAPLSDKGLYKISYSSFVVPLVKAVQELDEENILLKEKVTLLQGTLNDILHRLDLLEKNK